MKVPVFTTWCTAVVLIFTINISYAEQFEFLQPADLAADAHESRGKNIPIMILFSSVYCVYCEFIKREFLVPMLKSGDYVNKVIINVVEDDIGDEVIDFNGELIDTDSLSDRYSIIFTPTIIFVDSEGQELTERIVGLGNPDFFGGDIDQAIDDSLLEFTTDIARFIP